MVVARCPAAEEPDQHAGQLLRPHFHCLQRISYGPTQLNYNFWSVESKKKINKKLYESLKVMSVDFTEASPQKSKACFSKFKIQ
jgi:hypothetical protein